MYLYQLESRNNNVSSSCCSIGEGKAGAPFLVNTSFPPQSNPPTTNEFILQSLGSQGGHCLRA